MGFRLNILSFSLKIVCTAIAVTELGCLIEMGIYFFYYLIIFLFIYFLGGENLDIVHITYNMLSKVGTSSQETS